MQLPRPALVLVAMATSPLTLLALGTTSSAATTADVSTDPTGAHVELRRHDTWVERRASGGGQTTGCRRRWIPSGAFLLRKTFAGDYRSIPMTDPGPGTDYSPYQVWCNAEYIDTVWIRPQQFGVDPRDIAERLVRDLPYPATAVAAVPATRGLTGLESWFWVTGYTGAPILDTVSRFGLRVDVEATPDSVSWDFGDGATANGLGLGTPPPAAATVTHTYETRARPTFRVRSLVRLAVRWRVNGGAWQTLNPLIRTATLSYPVVESRAALVPDR